MVNVDTLTAVVFMRELAGKSAKGSVKYSQIKDPSEVFEKIVYDDRKPEKDDKQNLTAYPVIYDYRHQQRAVIPYDSVLAGIKVRYCVYDEFEFDYVGFYVSDDASSGDFLIRNGRIHCLHCLRRHPH